jgi:hypothetical protein
VSEARPRALLLEHEWQVVEARIVAFGKPTQFLELRRFYRAVQGARGVGAEHEAFLGVRAPRDDARLARGLVRRVNLGVEEQRVDGLDFGGQAGALELFAELQTDMKILSVHEG